VAGGCNKIDGGPDTDAGEVRDGMGGVGEQGHGKNRTPERQVLVSGIPKDTRDAVALVRQHRFHGGQVIRYVSVTPTEDRPLVDCSPRNRADIACGQSASVAKTLFNFLIRICDDSQWRMLFVEREPSPRQFNKWRKWVIKYSRVIEQIDDDVWHELERIRKEEKECQEA